MKIYKCPTCSKEFNKKCNFDDHVYNRKKPCNVKLVIIENSNLLVGDINNKSNIFCEFCNKEFSRKDSLNRHLNNFCKQKKTNNEVNEMKEFCIKILDELKEYKNELNILKEQKQSTTITNNDQSQNINNNISNNNVSNNNNVINSNNNITVVQFGQEDINKLDLSKLMEVYLKSTGGNIIANMLKYINLNPEHPEFNSIYMSDLAREIVKIHDGKKFVSKKFKIIKDLIINKVSGNINKICDKFLEDITLKKNQDILNKMHINEVSLKLINGCDAEEIVREEIKQQEKLIEFEKQKLIKNTSNQTKNNITIESDTEDECDMTETELNRVKHLEDKKDGLIQITTDKIKDELYNNKSLFMKK